MRARTRVQVAIRDRGQVLGNFPRTFAMIAVAIAICGKGKGLIRARPKYDGPARWDQP